MHRTMAPKKAAPKKNVDNSDSQGGAMSAVEVKRAAKVDELEANLADTQRRKRTAGGDPADEPDGKRRRRKNP